MGEIVQFIKKITFIVLFSVGLNWVLAQPDDPESYTAAQSSSYFFYQQPEYPKDCRNVLKQCSSFNSSGVHYIKPSSYIEPFEVYCENEETSNGWTVIGRRQDGSISFNRNWTDFRNGFGFLSGEFWLGNEKLSYLTNQGVYNLRIDMVFSNGSSFTVVYDSFRISDEWGQFAIVSLGSYNGDLETVAATCPLNMIFGTCTCQPTCNKPNDTTGCVSSCVGTGPCICAEGFLKKGDECVPPNECGCFLTDINRVISDGESYVGLHCLGRYTCKNDTLSSDSSYRCDSNAECRLEGELRKCYCREGFQGDGLTCNPLYTDCYDAYQAGRREDGVYTILPSGWPGSPFNVSCVMSTNGGGWTVFLRRTDGRSDLYHNWTSYRYGFGSFDGDFWLGNEQLHFLTNQKNYKLRIDIVTSGGSSKYDEYASFRISDNDNKFRIDDLGSHSGTAANGMCHTSGRSFSTYDEDNDECGNHNCAQRHRGAWWYASSYCSYCYGSHCYHFQYSSSCHTYCSLANLNGNYNGRNGEGIFWGCSPYYCDLNFAEMKLRPT